MTHPSDSSPEGDGAIPLKPQGAQPEQTPPVTPGQIIGGRYLVGTLIGQGGMGLVCAATHLGLESPVAIKLIRPDLKEDAEFVERFLNEARRAAALSSEHVATVHDVGRLETGEPYLVMERLEGVELETHLRATGPLEPRRAAELVLEACEGLVEAHAAGIVHRDLKPANLFLARRGDGKEVLKILDFGIAKTITDDAPSSSTSRSLGSPWYMSPEQMLDASSVDFRADIWSLGVVLFELLTKRLPFEGQSVPEVCVKVLTAEAPSPSSFRPELEPELEAIVLRCLEKDRDRRYADVSELARELQAYLARAPLELESTEERPSDRYGSLTPISDEFRAAPTRRRSRSRALGIAGVAVTVLLAAGTVGLAFVDDVKGDARLALAPAQLEPGPEPRPLDAGNTPVDVAIVGPLVGSNASSAPAAATESPPEAATTGSVTAAARADSAVRASTPATPPNAVVRPPALSPGEIERRKARYEAWLREQGLQRLGDAASE